MRDKNLNWSTGFLGNRQQISRMFGSTTIYFVEGSFLIVICIYLGDNCIVFEHFTASIGDLMGSN
jgi:hypothetical protein